MTEYVRLPLTIDAIFTADGTIKPKRIILKEGVFNIDKVISTKRYCPRTVPCVAPIEYSIRVEGVDKKIYFEPHSNMWFSIKEVKK